MRLEFGDVLDEALDETRAKFKRYWNDSEPHRDAINFALGLFTGIVMRRMRGEPDPDPEDAEATEGKR